MATVYHRHGKCPRCGRIWEFFNVDEVDCNCHLYCEDGSKPSDCTTVEVTAAQMGDMKWPLGIHDHPACGGEDVMHRVRWCSTHSHFIMKPPILVKCMEGDRYSSVYRWHKGET